MASCQEVTSFGDKGFLRPASYEAWKKKKNIETLHSLNASVQTLAPICKLTHSSSSYLC